MAHMYKVSADISEKEKVVGGLITAVQAAWLSGGFVTTAGLFLALSKIMPSVLAIILALPIGLGIGLPFAFYKKEGLSLIEYLTLSHSFKKKSKQLINTLSYGKEGEDFFT